MFYLHPVLIGDYYHLYLVIKFMEIIIKEKINYIINIYKIPDISL